MSHTRQLELSHEWEKNFKLRKTTSGSPKSWWKAILNKVPMHVIWPSFNLDRFSEHQCSFLGRPWSTHAVTNIHTWKLPSQTKVWSINHRAVFHFCGHLEIDLAITSPRKPASLTFMFLLHHSFYNLYLSRLALLTMNAHLQKID